MQQIKQQLDPKVFLIEGKFLIFPVFDSYKFYLLYALAYGLVCARRKPTLRLILVGTVMSRYEDCRYGGVDVHAALFKPRDFEGLPSRSFHSHALPV